MRLKLSLLFGALALTGAVAAERGDLYGGVSVGMSAADLPEGSYRDFVCVAPKGSALKGFADWKTCDADADHLHEMHVEANEPHRDDTIVAGHPVDLTLGFNDEGKLARIVIDTKPKVPMFMRKKSFLLGLQARGRYGEDGWDCKDSPLAADEEPLGSTSVNERCVKTVGPRRITIVRKLWRKVGADQKAFTNESHVTIDLAS